MGVAEMLIAANAVILKIHAITGWSIPEPVYANILKDQFIKKMQEGYANTNVDELEYAFRTYGTTVKDWGKNMNLSLIDEVMIPYLQSRSEVSKMEESKKPLAIENKENLSDQSMQDWLEDQQKQVQAGKLPVSFIAVMLYEFAVKKQIITPSIEQKKEYMVLAAKYTQAKLIEDAGDKEVAREMSEFNAMMASGVFTGKYVESIKVLAKKMILFQYFKGL